MRQRLLNRDRDRRYRASLSEEATNGERVTRRNRARDIREAGRTQFANWGRQTTHDDFLECNFNGDVPVNVGSIDVPCPSCGALRFPNEHSPSCCAHGQVTLPTLETVSRRNSGDSGRRTTRFMVTFKQYIRRFNNAFGMASLELASRYRSVTRR